jgi:hypothetical protein
MPSYRSKNSHRPLIDRLYLIQIAVADDPAVTAIGLAVFFRSPHKNMPNLILSQAETDNAIAYILSLK